MPHILWKVFQSTQDWSKTFRPSVLGRLLLFPTDGFVLGKEQFASLAFAAKQSHGETKAVAIDVEGRAESEITAELGTSVDLTDFKAYALRRDHGEFLTECCLLSPSGMWGVWLTQESFALVGGTLQFVNHFKEAMPAVDEQSVLFAKAWLDASRRNGASTTWLRPLMQHIHGEPKASRLIAEAGAPEQSASSS